MAKYLIVKDQAETNHALQIISTSGLLLKLKLNSKKVNIFLNEKLHIYSYLYFGIPYLILIMFILKLFGNPTNNEISQFALLTYPLFMFLMGLRSVHKAIKNHSFEVFDAYDPNNNKVYKIWENIRKKDYFYITVKLKDGNVYYVGYDTYNNLIYVNDYRYIKDSDDLITSSLTTQCQGKSIWNKLYRKYNDCNYRMK